MDAGNSLCRYLLMAAAMASAIGCQSNASGLKARGQMPQDPRPPITTGPASTAPSTSDPFAPIAPLAPPSLMPPNAPSGVVPANSVKPIVGTPVPAEARTWPSANPSGEVVPAVYTGSLRKIPSVVEMLKNSTPQVKVVAIVGANSVITDQEVREAVYQQMQSPRFRALSPEVKEAKKKELYAAELRTMIERELVLDDIYAKLKKAKKLAVIEELRHGATESANARIRAYKRGVGIESDEVFSLFLSAQELTLPVMRRQLERQFMADQYIRTILKDKARPVGLGEIRDYYDSHPEEFAIPEHVKWQHVFISFQKHPAIPAAYDATEAIRKKAAAGADFGAWRDSTTRVSRASKRLWYRRVAR